MAAQDITAAIAYTARTDFRQRYYANDHARDTVVLDPHRMTLYDGRSAGCSLDAEGFTLVPHVSAVADFEDARAVARIHPGEIEALLLGLTGADAVFPSAGGLLRFSEKSGRAGSQNNSMPARFAHVDTSHATSQAFARNALPKGRSMRRYAHYNVWRAISGPPQDVPLAVCDARSVPPESLITADAIFDEAGKPEWGFESYLVTHHPDHRWSWFPDMTRDEALVFRTSDMANPHPVPHVAFDNPLAPADAPHRASIEMRAVAYWYG